MTTVMKLKMLGINNNKNNIRIEVLENCQG